MNPAIYFEPDGYLLGDAPFMGRRSAGNGFLRAAVQGREDGPLSAYTPSEASAQAFRDFVAELDPAAATQWIPGRRLDLLSQVGLLYRPDQILGPMARRRLRAGPAAYSLCGVTHTLATHTTLDEIARIVAEPVMAWDALVCTSTVARAVTDAVLDQAEALHLWRFGQGAPAPRPLLPVIPLGVHATDFDFSAADRQAARARLGLADDAVAVLWAGRLSANGKAHPFATFRALQTAAETTGRPLTLVFAGQAPSPQTHLAFASAAARFCPKVRTHFVDGADPVAFPGAWAAADIFLSLADSLQETFGLTPIEAMAAGLPALVSDWNGYKDTVRHGIDGFRIPTWTPPPGAADATAHDYEVGAIDYEMYLYQTTMAVTVDLGELTARLVDLVTDADLRRCLGASGRERARATFDWAVIYRRYQELWAEQAAMRRQARDEPQAARWLAAAPRRGADHLGPFDTFASFATHHADAGTIVSLTGDLTPQAYRRLVADPLLSLWVVQAAVFDRVHEVLQAGPTSLADLGRATGFAPAQLAEVVTRLAKVDAVALRAP